MKLQGSHMRLFNGHQRMSEQSLKKLFLVNLNNIFCIKKFLVDNLPIMAESATFVDLKNALLEITDDIKVQLLRMEAIYKLLKEKHEPGNCIGIKAYLLEAYRATKEPGMTRLEQDFTLLYHLKALEAIEIACYDTLHNMARAMPTDDMSVLLKHNLDMAKDSKELYEMIMKEYIL